MSAVVVREENHDDADAIRVVNEAAFGQPDEAALVDRLRAGGDIVVSLVAQVAGSVVGHVLLSQAAVVDDGARVPCLALAPVAVTPNLWRRGIGSQLIGEALRIAQSRGHRLVVVLGHPKYYPRFGFAPASAMGIRCPYEAPDEAWMVLTLQSGSLEGVAGVVEYATAFGEL